MHAAETNLRNHQGPSRSRDRRRFERIPARGLASHLHTADANVPGLPVENISVGGMFVRSASPLRVGTQVMLQVVRPGLKRAIQATGRVVSVVSPAEARERQGVAGMGIRLDRVDQEAEARLRALVDDLTIVAATTPAPAVAAPVAAAPAVVNETASALEMTRLELAEAEDRLGAQARQMSAQAKRMAEMEAELKALRTELLRRNRTIGDLARRLSVHEDV